MPDHLISPEVYQTFIYTLREHYPSIRRSTLVYIPSGMLFGRVEGNLLLDGGIILCVQEYLNFDLGVIQRYGYEVSRAHILPDNSDFPIASEYCRANYHNKDKLYWYDSFPHPNDPSLAVSDPHHKHVHPDIKRNRIPAPELSFTKPNLPFLIREIEQLLTNESQRPPGE